MKAIQVSRFGNPEVLEYVEYEKPTANMDNIVIQVEATSVNFADLKARVGLKSKSQPPFIPGLDVAGTIIDVGEKVKELYVGQRVVAFPQTGAYAEYVLASEALTFPVPDNIDFATAAACPIAAFTAYNLIMNIGQVQPDETILIHAAAGGVGTTAIQIAKSIGLVKIIGTVSREEKVSVAQEAGADYVIDLSKEHFVDRVLDLTKGSGADVIFDSVAGNIGEESVQCLAIYGRLVHFGNSSGHKAMINMGDLHGSCRSVLGYSMGTTRKMYPYLLKPIAEEVFELLSGEELKMRIGHVFPLEETKKAHELMEHRKSTGKILLLPNHSSLSDTYFHEENE